MQIFVAIVSSIISKRLNFTSSLYLAVIFWTFISSDTSKRYFASPLSFANSGSGSSVIAFSFFGSKDLTGFPYDWWYLFINSAIVSEPNVFSSFSDKVLRYLNGLSSVKLPSSLNILSLYLSVKIFFSSTKYFLTFSGIDAIRFLIISISGLKAELSSVILCELSLLISASVRLFIISEKPSFWRFLIKSLLSLYLLAKVIKFFKPCSPYKPSIYTYLNEP